MSYRVDSPMCAVCNLCQGKSCEIQTIHVSNMQRNLSYIAQSMFDIVMEVWNAVVRVNYAAG